MQWISRIVRGTIVIAILIVWYAAMSVYVFSWKTDQVSADIAVVLGAAAWGNRPSPMLRERINHAVALYNDGSVQKIVFTGGQGVKSSRTEAAVSADYARQLGVPDSAIVLEDQSLNTVGNLENVRILAQEQGFETMLIVSTPFHQKRALFIAQRLGLNAYTSPTRTTRWIPNRRTNELFYIREVVANIHHKLLWPWLAP